MIRCVALIAIGLFTGAEGACVENSDPRITWSNLATLSKMGAVRVTDEAVRILSTSDGRIAFSSEKPKTHTLLDWTQGSSGMIWHLIWVRAGHSPRNVRTAVHLTATYASAISAIKFDEVVSYPYRDPLAPCKPLFAIEDGVSVALVHLRGKGGFEKRSRNLIREERTILRVSITALANSSKSQVRLVRIYSNTMKKLIHLNRKLLK